MPRAGRPLTYRRVVHDIAGLVALAIVSLGLTAVAYLAAMVIVPEEPETVSDVSVPHL